ncbi:D-glycero-beta-D-manno-heptose 1-phosphate adenylyltransferase [Actinokineospora sp. UTMC 2448]|uniref:D-glycero-beta-D-manno-heptose 1-phosphate adenylyltransferase n=1 Tax=Actinokineospora sp. UTMC 2448 TaxID=2268449 RepID=UPI0021649F90|nr:D-glycero-beta-D-manno-heptose 1-phosphate adenylyltransferase [Actinokineospora sp. UTMC 2448]UVS79793.1 Bifunctional protein HldE [Actinokineospora sp. UTMC 2448]
MTTHAITADLPRRLAARKPRIAVIGDAILDVWLEGDAGRLCREAPAPVVSVHTRHAAAGGAANTAVNLAALGAETTLVGAIGPDQAGAELRDLLDAAGVDTHHLVVGPQTVVKHRVLAADHLMVRYDEGEVGEHDATTCQAIAESAAHAVADADAVVLCDYGLGVCGPVLARFLDKHRDGFPLLVVDAHEPARWAGIRPDLVTPNAAEAEGLLGEPLPAEDRVRAVIELGERLRAAAGAKAVVVTLDREGSVLVDDGPGHRTWAEPAPESQAAGAGDTFCAALTVAAAAGLPLSTAAELAQTAADIVVHRPGTSVCTTEDLAARLGAHQGAAVAAAELADLVRAHRAQGRRVVFTNGCFDMLHRGHIAYLNQARRLGDVLVVAVNGDASVRRLKGDGRPVNPAADRAEVLAALSCVDHVTVFDEDSPAELIRLLRPDCYVKGGDYTESMLDEAAVVRECGGEVRIVDYVPDQSTSAVIDRIVSQAGR